MKTSSTLNVRRQAIHRQSIVFALLCMIAISVIASDTRDQSSVFTYQGRLTREGVPANGNHDFLFWLKGDLDSDVALGTNLLTVVPVTEGLFTVALNFGLDVFDGTPRFLEIGVRPTPPDAADAASNDASFVAAAGPGGGFVIIGPAVPITSAPVSMISRRSLAAVSVLPGGVTAASLGILAASTSAVSVIGITPSGSITSLPPSSTWWDLKGNAGTTALNFVGTTDPQPLELRVNSSRALRLEPRVISPNLIGGSAMNAVELSAEGVSIGGGGRIGGINRVGSSFGVIGGGADNYATNEYATISGGQINIADGTYATVGGGEFNTAHGEAATVAGGGSGLAEGPYATVGGGHANRAIGYAATVGGGEGHRAFLHFATVSGGEENGAIAPHATVGGGQVNEASGPGATIGGGIANQAPGLESTVGGGTGNQTIGFGATIGGGRSNDADGEESTVAGGRENEATAPWASVLGGTDNRAAQIGATVGGGGSNMASGPNSTIGGGGNNTASGASATVGGGTGNEASGTFASVPGGFGSRASQYGQMAHSSGLFQGAGDAQTSVYMLRNQTGTNGSTRDLFLDGTGTRLRVEPERTLTFDILIAARKDSTLPRQSAGFSARGVVMNDGGVARFVGAPVVTSLGQDDPAWMVSLGTAGDALVITVTSGGTVPVPEIRWVARVQTAETAW